MDPDYNEIAGRLAAAPRVLVGLDFDGTLTPIIADPDQVTLAPAIPSLIRHLADSEKFVPAIVSGRSLVDVRQRVGIADIYYAGNHGMEIFGPGLSFVDRSAEERNSLLVKITEALRARLAETSGVLIEAKGLTTSVHYRAVEEAKRPQVGRLLQQTVAEMGGAHFKITSGLLVWEIRPVASSNKGTALVRIRQHLSPSPDLVVYLGDDTTDEDAFRAFPGQVTVKVGPARPTAARYAVAGTAEAIEFLEWLVRQPRAAK